MDEKKLDFMDEKIIHLLNEDYRCLAEQSKQRDIVQGVQAGLVVLDNISMEFEEKSLLEDKIRIRLPKSFTVMSPEIAAIKFPSERRPGLIYSNSTASISISFNHTNNNVLEDQINEAKNSMLQVLKKLQPSAVWLEDGVKTIAGKNIGYFDFLTKAIDTDIYNFMFLVELDGRLLMCNFNCTVNEMEDWKFVARGIMESLRIYSN